MKVLARRRTGETMGYAMPPPVAFLLDLGLVLIFSAFGRASHGQFIDAAGTLGTAWPFLVGTAMGWALAWWIRKVPPMNANDGVLVWLATFSIGMALRVLTGAGTAPAFIAVTMVVTAILLLGWRFVADLVVMRRR